MCDVQFTKLERKREQCRIRSKRLYDNKNYSYSTGKIYIIKSPNTDRVYIGCTILSLQRRMRGHKQKKDCYSMDIINAGGAYIELLEDYPCNNKFELENREKHYMKFYYNICVNRIDTTLAHEIKEEREWYFKRDEQRYKDLKKLGPINPDELD